MLKLGMSLFAGVMLLGAMACDDGVADKIENRSKCRKICSQLDECNASVDTGECTDSCADLAEDDDTERRMENCSSCLDVGDSCGENVRECATECTGIVTLTAVNS